MLNTDLDAVLLRDPLDPKARRPTCSLTSNEGDCLALKQQ